MNAKYGIIFGVNLAVTAMFMQGCKATKPQGEVQPQPQPPAAPVVQQPAPKTAAQHDIETVRYTETKPVAKPVVEPAKPVVKPKVEKPLPPPEPEYTEYTVKKGDILSRICVKHGVRQRDVLKLNPGLNPNVIYVGKKIRLPVSSALPAEQVKAPAAPAQAKSADAKPLASKASAANVKAPVTKKSAYKPYIGPTKEYVVKSGDQIGKIAYSYGITARALKELNGLADSNLRIGQKLKVPAEKVKADEAKPAAPAQDKKAAPEKAAPEAAPAPAAAAPAPAASAPAAAEPAPAEAAPAPAAEAAPAAAEPAQAQAPAAPTTYTVKEGEDLVAIAINFGLSPSALMDLNDLKATDEVKPGQVLKLPAGAKAQ